MAFANDQIVIAQDIEHMAPKLIEEYYGRCIEFNMQKTYCMCIAEEHKKIAKQTEYKTHHHIPILEYKNIERTKSAGRNKFVTRWLYTSM